MTQEKYLQAKIAQDPSNPKKHLALISHYMNEHASDDLTEALLNMLNSMDRDDPLLDIKVHRPLIKALSAQGLWSLIEPVCQHLVDTYGLDEVSSDEPLLRLVRQGRRNVRKYCPYPEALPSGKGEAWWTFPDVEGIEGDKLNCYITRGDTQNPLTVYIVGHEDTDCHILNVICFSVDVDDIVWKGTKPLTIPTKAVMVINEDDSYTYYPRK